MKPRKMRDTICWAVVRETGQCLAVLDTRAEARLDAKLWSVPTRVVRVRVTEAP